MGNEIDIQVEDVAYLVDEGRLMKAVEATLLAHEQTEVGISIVIGSDEQVQALNRAHRGVDSVTDILSFTAEALPFDLEDEVTYLGDLVIAYPYATEQARSLNHSIVDNMDLLVIHGTLHLLGYDHDDEASRKEMWQVQSQILKGLGISDEIVPDLEGFSGHHVE
ncbi:hypothetical protein MASR2M15_17700 [Anaerolineales bacterium]